MKELIAIQAELKAPKGQRNNFGNYNYRSCEDILEAVKPLCHKNNCFLTLSDAIVMLGDRFYIKATAKITNSEGVEVLTTAFAREAETKKGMDCSQITGSASSYARKYALNGLFDIDDTKDADTMDNRHSDPQKVNNLASDSQRKTLEAYMKKFTKANNAKAIDYITEALVNQDLTSKEADAIIKHSKGALNE